MPSNERTINPFHSSYTSSPRHVIHQLCSASPNDSNFARYKNLSFSDTDNKAVNVESEIWMAIS